MANPLFNSLMGNLGNQQNGNNMQSSFENFKRTVQGDPQAMVEELVNSGKMSRQQYQQLFNVAQGLRGILR